MGIVALLLHVALSWSIGCTQESAEVKKAKHKERATQYFEKGDYREAIIEFKNVTRLDPLDADAHYRQGLSHLKLGTAQDLQEALKALKATVDVDAANLDAQVKLGQLYLMSNDPTNARKRADIVLTSTPDQKDGRILRGLSLVGEQRLPEGIAELKKAIELDPGHWKAYSSRGVVKKDLGDLDGAIRDHIRAIEINPKVAANYGNRG